MRILGSMIDRQLGSSIKWGRQWVVDDDDFFSDSTGFDMYKIFSVVEVPYTVCL